MSYSDLPVDIPHVLGYQLPREMVLEISLDVKKKAIHKMIYQMYEKMIENNPASAGLPEDVLNYVVALQEKKANCKSTHVMITVNPKPDVPLCKFLKKIKSFIELKWVDNTYRYALEQRSDGTVTLGTGVHVHILIKRDSKVTPSTIKRETQRLFGKLVENPKDPHTINFHFGDATYAANAEKYICGLKKDDDKKQKCLYDNKWRAIHNLDEYYSAGNVVDE